MRDAPLAGLCCATGLVPLVLSEEAWDAVARLDALAAMNRSLLAAMTDDGTAH